MSTYISRCKKSLTAPALAFVGWFLVCQTALAAGNFEVESENLILNYAKWFQRLTTLLAVVAIVEAGSRFWSEEKSQGARAHMKNVLIGCAISFGAVGIAEVLKASFSGRI